MQRRALLPLPFVLLACGSPDEIGVVSPPSIVQEARPDTPGNDELFRFDSGDVVEFFDSAGGRFRIHFTRAGRHAVPAADGDNDSVPDHVESVASIYESVLTLYSDTLGFRPPVSDDGVADNGGDGRFDVYLVDFALSADGHFRQEACLDSNPEICSGYMVQENDFAGYGYASADEGNRVLASHEFFHAVQAAYDVGQGSVFSEGTAVWATEKFDATLDDLEGFIDGYFDNPDRALDAPLPGPVDPFSYGSGIFFQFLDEKYGADVIRELWEAAENGHAGVADPIWIEQLDAVLASRSSSFANAFTEFGVWNLFTGRFADAERAYQGGLHYPPVRIDEHTAPFEDDALRVFHASVQYHAAAPGSRTSMTAALLPTTLYPDALTDTRLVLAMRSGFSQTEPVVIDPSTESVPVFDTPGVGLFIAAVVNVSPVGSSRRPAFCLGSPDEVAACRARFSGEQPDAGVVGDAGTVNPPPDAGPGDDGGPWPFHCAQAGEGAAGWLLFAALWMVRRSWGRR